MKLTNLTIEDLFTDDAKLTFLVGAGCSVDAPSCLPAGRAMMEAIIKYACAESEKSKILELKELRFEQLVEIIRDRLDPELKLIDYYGAADKPNIQHFFLAEMIKKGHFVMTTNFDSLIEYALLQSNVPKEEIIPVITKEDFKKYNDPDQLFKQGKKIVYKIHGSPKNIIKPKENTKDSLVATIRAFGSNKEGGNVFQLESFKQPSFVKTTKGRSLVIIGYSGSDDFDIVPTLTVLKNIKNIIWINYIPKDDNKEKIYQIDDSITYETDKPDKINHILKEIYKFRNIDYIYRADTNTSRLIEEILDIKPKLGSDKFSISPNYWLKINVKAPDEYEKYIIPYRIYSSFDMHDDAMRCSVKILSLAEKKGNKKWESVALNNIGTIHAEQGNYSEALKKYKQALKIDDILGHLSGKATHLNNIGMIYKSQGNYSQALKTWKEAFKIAENLGNLLKKASCLNNIGLIYEAQGKYTEAINKYNESLKIAEKLGDLPGKAVYLNNIASIHADQGNYPEALKRYEEALQIDKKLGSLLGKANDLNNIGKIYQDQGNYPEALKRYEETLMIDEQLGDLKGKATCLNNIGNIYQNQGNYPESLKRYEKALIINEQLGDLKGKATLLNNIAEIYRAKGNYPKALKMYNKALQINTKLGNLTGKTTCINNIALIYEEQRNYSEALKMFKKVLKCSEQLGDLPKKAGVLNNIGMIYEAQEDYSNAWRCLEEGLQIFTQLGLSNSLDAKILKGNIEFLKSRAKFRPQRRKSIKVGRNEPCPCGSGKKYKICCGRIK